MRVLVTGATGFIGREVCKQLSAAGIDFVPAARSPGQIAGRDISLLDLTKPLPPSLFCDIDAVIHLAGIAHQRASPALYDQVNYRATVALFAAAQAAKVAHFIFVSSVKAMGSKGGDAICTETDDCAPGDDYGRSKLAAEAALAERRVGADTALTILRPALVYGPEASGNLRLLNTLVSRGLPTPPEHGARSMISVADFSRLLLCVTSQPARPYRLWLACDGQRYSTRRLYLALRSRTGKPDSVFTIPLWCWRLAASCYDVLTRNTGQSTYHKLFGVELYSSAAVQAETGWRPQQRFEDVV